MDISISWFGQVLRKLCLFEPLQFREPLPGHCCSRALSRDNAPHKLAYLLTHISKWGVLEHSRILTPWATHSSWPYPHDAYSTSPRGWEAFPTPRALIHTRITWAFSPSAPQVVGVTPGSPLCPWCFRHPLWRGARHMCLTWNHKLKEKFWFINKGEECASLKKQKFKNIEFCFTKVTHVPYPENKNFKI
jgi:hypothetical protein